MLVSFSLPSKKLRFSLYLPVSFYHGIQSCRGDCIYSSMVLTQSHPPFKLSFHKLTLLSPPLTANTFPLKLQLTLQTTASNLSSVLVQLEAFAGSALAGQVQMRTVLS